MQTLSIFVKQVASNSSQNVELVLQESCTDDSGSLVVYSIVNVDDIKLTMNGENPSCIALLPHGFVITPVTQNPNGDINTTGSGGGCLLTVGLQLLANSLPTAKLNLSSANTVNNHIQTTVQQIINALGGITTNPNTSTSNTANSASVASADDGDIVVGGFDEPPTPVPTESSPTSQVN